MQRLSNGDGFLKRYRLNRQAVYLGEGAIHVGQIQRPQECSQTSTGRFCGKYIEYNKLGCNFCDRVRGSYYLPAHPPPPPTWLATEVGATWARKRWKNETEQYKIQKRKYPFINPFIKPFFLLIYMLSFGKWNMMMKQEIGAHTK